MIANNSETRRRKKLARRQVETAVLSGKITKTPCEKCGDEKSEAHHPDHGLPLQIQWLCKAHHSEAHNTLTSALRALMADNPVLTHSQIGLILSAKVESLRRIKFRLKLK